MFFGADVCFSCFLWFCFYIFFGDRTFRAQAVIGPNHIMWFKGFQSQLSPWPLRDRDKCRASWAGCVGVFTGLVTWPANKELPKPRVTWICLRNLEKNPKMMVYQRKFRNLTSDYTESCCWRSVNQEMWSRRCDTAEMWDMRIWRVGSAKCFVFT